MGEGPGGFHGELLSLISELRERRRQPSLRQVASAASVSPSHVSEIFNGRSIPSPVVATAVAAALGASREEQRAAGSYAGRAADARAKTSRDAAKPAALIPRSAYVQQVRRIAPAEIEDRNAELAELAVFCTTDEGCSYVWLRAPAWAGKSALMSWFVLHPPPGVRVVSFFITARLAGQDTRGAFIEVLLEQLAGLLQLPVPPLLSDATREAHLLAMLADAADQCRRRAERLVLLVDGLDEDRSSGRHSIAGLLPARPEAGLRVIVAGRPNPPIPSDVRDDHPLRDPGIVRELAPSAHATALRADAEHDLKALLRGTPAEQDLLGLVTAAVGGLSGLDLAELTGWNQWEIEEHLHAVTGRMFARRPGRWNPDTDPELYLLGHEELQNTASRLLGPTRLQTYRQRLHTWADTYRGRGWPPGTPEYLLRGYPRMLAGTGDIDRLVALAIDLARHDRMLDLSGGDTAALTEITVAQDLVLAQATTDLHAMARLSIRRNALVEITTAQDALSVQGKPNLAALGRLAVHRWALGQRNSHIPPDLPLLWARLGKFHHAEALADSITSLDLQVQALIDIAQMLVGTDQDRARKMAERADSLAHSITDPNKRSQADELAGTRSHHTEARVRVIPDPTQQEWALKELADTKPDDDENLASWLSFNPFQRAATIGTFACSLFGTDPDRARKLADKAEVLASSLAKPQDQAWALTYVAHVWIGIDPDRARNLAARVEALARSITDPQELARTLTKIADALIHISPGTSRSLMKRTETLARSIPDPKARDWALAGIAYALSPTDTEWGEALARSVADHDKRMEALIPIAEGMAGIDPDRAEVLARSLPEPYDQARALRGIARVLAADNPDRAETLVDSIDDVHDQRAWALVDVAKAMAHVDPERSETLARSVIDPSQQAHALLGISQAVIDTDPNRSRGLAERAEALATLITAPETQVSVLVAVAEVLVDTDPDRSRQVVQRAEVAARSIQTRNQTHHLRVVARAMAATDPDRAEMLARSLIESVSFGDEWALVLLVQGLAATDPARGEAIALSIAGSKRRAEALSNLAMEVPPDRAMPLLASVLRMGYWQTCLRAVTRADPSAAAMIAEEALKVVDATLAPFAI